MKLFINIILMKTFKTFLFEEMTANNVSISDVAPQITDTPKNLNFTPPTSLSTKQTKPDGKLNTKKPNNKSDDDEDDEDLNDQPDFETWLANHPMPPLSADENDDGVVTAAEQAAYEQAWSAWRDMLLNWMYWRHAEQEPTFDDDVYIPGEQNNNWEHWYRGLEHINHEYQGQPGDPPLNLPFDMSKEDYEMWKDLLRIRGTEAREIFDWIWRYYRAGQEGFPNVESPVHPGENPLDDPWSEPLFPNSSPGPSTLPGQHHS
jgi:hypothetical protein